MDAAWSVPARAAGQLHHLARALGARAFPGVPEAAAIPDGPALPSPDGAMDPAARELLRDALAAQVLLEARREEAGRRETAVWALGARAAAVVRAAGRDRYAVTLGAPAGVPAAVCGFLGLDDGGRAIGPEAGDGEPAPRLLAAWNDPLRVVRLRTIAATTDGVVGDELVVLDGGPAGTWLLSGHPGTLVATAVASRRELAGRLEAELAALAARTAHAAPVAGEDAP